VEKIKRGLHCNNKKKWKTKYYHYLVSIDEFLITILFDNNKKLNGGYCRDQNSNYNCTYKKILIKISENKIILNISSPNNSHLYINLEFRYILMPTILID
jgi:hypothetical protein